MNINPSNQADQSTEKQKPLFSLDLQILLKIVIFSTALAILMTCAQLYNLYVNDRGRIDSQFDAIRQSRIDVD